MHEGGYLAELTTAVSKNIALKNRSSFEVRRCLLHQEQCLVLVHLSNSN